MEKTRHSVALHEEDTQKGRFLIFSVGKEDYGIEIKYITEIIGIQSISQMPEMPDYVKGIINLRGKIIPVMDMNLRFKQKQREYNDRTCIIVVDVKNSKIGLIIDSVSEVISIPEHDITEPPRLDTGNGNRYIKKIGKVGTDVKLILDCEMLLSDEEIANMSDVT